MKKHKTPEQVKQELRQRGETATSWAERHNYRREDVYRVLNGQSKALYGLGHEIAVKLGLKSEPGQMV